MSDAPEIAASFLLGEFRTLDDDQWQEILDYLADYAADKETKLRFRDMDLDEIETLKKDHTSVLVLEQAFKNKYKGKPQWLTKETKNQLARAQYGRNLAREWRLQNSKPVPKRARDTLDLVEDARRTWASNPRRLPTFEKFQSEWSFKNFESIVQDDTLVGFGVRVPVDLFALLSNKLIELLNRTSLQRIYVRAVDFTEEPNVLFVSSAAYAQLLAPNAIMTQTFSPPAVEDIDMIHFVYDGLQGDLDRKRAVLESELSSLLSGLPALSLGLRLSTPTGGTVIVDRLTANGQSKFAVALPQYGILDIPYEIDVFQQDVALCANQLCEQTATHVCARCGVALYCSNAGCPEDGWMDGHHLICDLFV